MLPLDVCPTEDAVRVFLEHLVDPLLPAKYSMHETPSLLQQQSVAKQVIFLLVYCFPLYSISSFTANYSC